MAGIGEASAIIGITHVGFSLAKALNTYLSDLADASDDISSLVSDIEATLGQLRDLGKLIEKNESTNAWTDDGLRNAKKCVTDCDRIITKLRKLLKKSTASATSDEVNRDEIDVTKLERALWPFIKPRLEVYRRELQSIKQDIMIAYSSYMTKFGSDAERRKYTDDMPGLQRTRALARRQLREAKERRRRKGSDWRRKADAEGSAQIPTPNIRPGAVRPNKRSRGYVVGEPSLPAFRPNIDGPDLMLEGDDDDDDDDDDDRDRDDPLVYENLDELEREFETWKLEENERLAQEEAEKRAIQEDAVRNWKLQQSQEIESSRQKIEDARSSLRAELTTQRIAPQQIEKIVDHVHPRIDFSMLCLAVTPEKPLLPAGDLSGRGKTLVNEPHGRPIPDILKDPTAEGGMALLETIYLQLVGLPPCLRVFNVEVPDQWLFDSLTKKQTAFAYDSEQVNSMGKQFSELPDDYRFAICQWINEKSEQYKEYSVRWHLLHLECVLSRRRQNIFKRKSRCEVKGVYLVLKQHKKTRDHTAEPGDLHIVSHGASPPPPPRLESYDVTRSRHSRPRYEPQFAHSSSRRATSRPDSKIHSDHDASREARVEMPYSKLNTRDFNPEPRHLPRSISFKEPEDATAVYRPGFPTARGTARFERRGNTEAPPYLDNLPRGNNMTFGPEDDLYSSEGSSSGDSHSWEGSNEHNSSVGLADYPRAGGKEYSEVDSFEELLGAQHAPG
ncbi:MAG: hypothetical protein Q9202_002894 [Teloschistes flavicans]